MSIYKRGNVWWIRFTTPSGELVRESAETRDKQAAKEYHDKLKADSWRVAKLGQKPTRTWDEAAYRWLQEMQHKKSHIGDVYTIAWLQLLAAAKKSRNMAARLCRGVSESGTSGGFGPL